MKALCDGRIDILHQDSLVNASDLSVLPFLCQASSSEDAEATLDGENHGKTSVPKIVEGR